jgi:hypothetical protein
MQALKAGGYETQQEEKNAAEAKYQTKLADSQSCAKTFYDVIENITSSDIVDLHDYSIPKLDSHEIAAKDVIMVKIKANQAKFSAKKAAKKAVLPQPSNSALAPSKKITSAIAKKSVVENPPLSDETKEMLHEYNNKFNIDIEKQLALVSQNNLAEIKTRIISQNSSVTELKDFKLFEEGELDKKHPSYTKCNLISQQIYAEHNLSTESKALQNYQSEKATALESLIKNEIFVDLVPVAIKLHQLNDSLDPTHKLDTNSLNLYLRAAVSSHTSKLVTQSDISKYENNFVQALANPKNQSAYKYPDHEIPEDKLEAMKQFLKVVGIKEDILQKPQVAKAAPKELADTSSITAPQTPVMNAKISSAQRK